ncbi:MAG: hypothetical protein MJ181_05155 [Treponema sp.]|nr:hypothetical protein [Treponema sp.]
MKKIISCLFALVVLSSAAFSESIGFRYFELKFDVPAAISNNALGTKDIFQEELVIDFDKIASSLPKDGFIVAANTKPSFAVSLNLESVSVGYEAGLEVYGSLNISRSIFDFLAKGNKLNEEISASASGNFDVFAFNRVPVQVCTDNYLIGVTPTVFTPVAHAEVTKTKVSVQNKADGTVAAKGEYEVAIMSALQDESIKNEMYLENYNELFSNVGFDVGLSVNVPIIYGLEAKGIAQVPMVPGRLHSKAISKGSFAYDINLLDDEKSKNPEFKSEDLMVYSCNDTIHRPFELMGGVEYKPFVDGWNWLYVSGMVGLGVKYPFSSKAIAYPQYQAIGHIETPFSILGMTLSTEYMNQMFKHEIGFQLNARLIELDWGLSLCGADFAGSLAGKGYGVYMTLCMGF